jgi:hypothetical protein
MNCQHWGSRRGLGRKLHNHIVGSDGETSIEIGLECCKGKPRLSIWDPDIVSQCSLQRDIILYCQPIRKKDMEILHTYVKDFASLIEIKLPKSRSDLQTLQTRYGDPVTESPETPVTNYYTTDRIDVIIQKSEWRDSYSGIGMVRVRKL